MRMRSVHWGMLIWIVTGISFSEIGFGEESPESLQAGAFAQDITPKVWPISVNGGMSDIQATAAHDPLHARCLVLKNKETSLAIVVCDSCALPRDLVDRAKVLAAKKTRIPASHILISATHSHSCPTATPLFQSDPDSDYLEYLVDRIASGIEQANSQLEPARIGWGACEQRSLVFNRRWIVKEERGSEDAVETPFGIKSDRIITNPGYNNPKVERSINVVDPEVNFISIQSREGRPIALLANYSLHYVGGVPKDQVSADYFGEFAQRIARKLNATDLNPPFVGIMSNGTSGDVNNVDFRQKSVPDREPFEQISFVAELLAQDVAKSCENLEYFDAVPLKVRHTEIAVGVRKPIADEIASAERKIAGRPERSLTDLPSIYARETALLSEYPTSVRIKLQAIRIGSLGIAAIPCEVFTETGLALKRNSPLKRTFTISLANGYNGYLPPPEQHLLGGYETWRARSSYLAADSEPKIGTTLNRLLKELTR